MDNIDQLLKDFYGKYGQQPLDDAKLQTIKSTYGNNYDRLLTDLYTKYNQPLDNNKLKLIKDTYKLGTSISNTQPDLLNEYIGHLESNGRYNAKNDVYLPKLGRTSKATGKYQHIWDLHKDDIVKTTGIKDRETYLKTPEAQEAFQQVLNNQYQQALPEYIKIAQDRGLQLDEKELIYIMHHEGVAGGKDFLATGTSKFGSEKAINNRLKAGRKWLAKNAPQPTQVEVQAPVEQPSLTQLIDTEAKELANKKAAEKQQEFTGSPLKKFAYNWSRKSLIGDMLDGNGYGADTATPAEIEEAKLELLQSGKYGKFKSAEEMAVILDPKYKEKINKTIAAGDKVQKNLDEDFDTDAGLFDTNPFGDNKGYRRDGRTGQKQADIIPNFWVGDDVGQYWMGVDKVMTLTEHPLITKNPKKYNYREQKELNQHLRDIQADVSKPQQIKKEATTGYINNYLKYAEGRFKKLETELSSKYGNLEKLPEQAQIQIQQDPLFQEYQELAGNYEKEFANLKSKSANFKLAEANDNLEKVFNKKEDENHKKNYATLGFLEKSLQNVASFAKDAVTAAANMPGDVGVTLGTGIDSALGTDLGTTRGIASAYNAGKISTTAIKEGAIPLSVKLDTEDEIYAIYNDRNEIERFTDGSYFTISDDPNSETFKKLLVEEKKSVNSGKPSWGFNTDAFLHGVREPMIDMVPLILGGGAAKTLTTEAASVVGKTSRLGNTLTKVANSDRFLTFAGSFAGFSGKMMDGAIKEGGLVDSGDIFLATTAKVGLEAVIEAYNPMGGSLFTDKLFSSLSKQQVKQLSKIISEEGVFKALPIISRQFRKEILENGLGEGMEEILATIIEPTVVNNILNNTIGTAYDTNFSMKDVAESALVGMASGFAMGGILEGGPTALSALRNPSSVIQESLRAALQNKELFDNIIEQQKTRELQNTSDQDVEKVTAKYDKITKVMNTASSYSEKVFKEHPDTGHVPSSGIQTLYSNIAFSKATKENKKYDLEEDINNNSKSIEQDTKKLRQLDLFVGNSLDFFTSIEDINTSSKIMSDIELADNYSSVYNEFKNIISSVAKTKNSDQQKIALIEAKLKSKLVELKNKTENKVNDEIVTKAEEDLKVETAKAKEEEKVIKAEEAIQNGTATAEQLESRTKAQVQRVQDNFDLFIEQDDKGLYKVKDQTGLEGLIAENPLAQDVIQEKLEKLNITNFKTEVARVKTEISKVPTSKNTTVEDAIGTLSPEARDIFERSVTDDFIKAGFLDKMLNEVDPLDVQTIQQLNAVAEVFTSDITPDSFDIKLSIPAFREFVEERRQQKPQPVEYVKPVEKVKSKQDVTDNATGNTSSNVSSIEAKKKALGLEKVISLYEPSIGAPNFRMILKGDKFDILVYFDKNWVIAPKQPDGRFTSSDPTTGNTLNLNPREARKVVEKYAPEKLIKLLEEAATVKGITAQDNFMNGDIKNYLDIYKKENLEYRLDQAKQSLKYYQSPAYPNKSSQESVIKLQLDEITELEAELAALEQPILTLQVTIDAIEQERAEAHEQVDVMGIKGSGHKTPKAAHDYVDEIYNKKIAELKALEIPVQTQETKPVDPVIETVVQNGRIIPVTANGYKALSIADNLLVSEYLQAGNPAFYELEGSTGTTGKPRIQMVVYYNPKTKKFGQPTTNSKRIVIGQGFGKDVNNLSERFAAEISAGKERVETKVTYVNLNKSAFNAQNKEELSIEDVEAMRPYMYVVGKSFSSDENIVLLNKEADGENFLSVADFISDLKSKFPNTNFNKVEEELKRDINNGKVVFVKGNTVIPLDTIANRDYAPNREFIEKLIDNLTSDATGTASWKIDVEGKFLSEAVRKRSTVKDYTNEKSPNFRGRLIEYFASGPQHRTENPEELLYKIEYNEQEAKSEKVYLTKEQALEELLAIRVNIDHEDLRATKPSKGLTSLLADVLRVPATTLADFAPIYNVVGLESVGGAPIAPEAVQVEDQPIVTPEEKETKNNAPDEAPEAPKTKGRKGKTNTDFKISNADYVGRVEKAVSYLKTRFEEIGVEVNDDVLKNLVKGTAAEGSKVWGAFHNAMVTLSSISGEKIGRHEAMHVVFKMFLNKKQQVDILNELWAKHKNDSKYKGKEEQFKKEMDYFLKTGKFIQSDTLYKATDSISENVFSEYDFVNKLLNPANIKTLEDVASVILYFEDINFLNGIEDLEIFKKYNGKLESLDKVNYNLKKSPDSKTAKLAYTKLQRRNNKERRRIFLELLRDQYEQQNNKSFIDKVIEFVKKYLSKNKEVVKNKFEILADNVINSYKEGNIITKEGFIEEGYEKINFEKVVSSSKIGKYIIDKLYDTGFVLTGSLAYSPFGSVYRDSKNLLHDIDIISYTDRDTSNNKFLEQYPNSQLIYDISGKNEMLTYIVPQDGMIITDIVRRSGDTSMVTQYTVRDTNNNILGTFLLEYDVNDKGEVINRKEIKVGEEATFVDIFYNQKVINKTALYEYNDGANKVILNDPVNGFAAKYKIGRKKDKNDILLFNSESKKANLKTDSEQFYSEQSILTQLQEDLSDAFEDYKNTLLLPEGFNKKYPTIAKFINNLFNFLKKNYLIGKSYITNNKSINQLFYEVENNILGRDFIGRRKKNVRDTFQKALDNLEKPDFKVSDWSTAETYKFADFLSTDIFTRFLQDKYKRNNMSEVMAVNKELSPTALFNEFRTNLKDILNSYKNNIVQREKLEQDSEDYEILDGLLTDIYNQYTGENPNTAFSFIVNKRLENRFVKGGKYDDIKEEDLVAEQNDNENEVKDTSEENQLESWQTKQGKIDAKTKSSARLREFFSSFPLRTRLIKNGKSERTTITDMDLYNKLYYKGEYIHNKLLVELSDNSTYTDFITAINNLVPKHQFAGDLLGSIMNLSEEQMMEAYDNGTLELPLDILENQDAYPSYNMWILKDMYQAIADQTNLNPHKTLTTSKGKQVQTTQVVKSVKDTDYDNAVRSIKETIDNKLSNPVSRATLKDVLEQTIDAIDKKGKVAGFIIKVFSQIGYEASNELLLNLQPSASLDGKEDNLSYLKKGLVSILNDINDSKSVIDATGRGVDIPAKLLSTYSTISSGLSYMNVENENEFAHKNSNYLTRLQAIWNKGADRRKQWVDNMKMFNGQPILGHYRNPFYTDFLNENYTYKIVADGFIQVEGQSNSGKPYADYNKAEIIASSINAFLAKNNVAKEKNTIEKGHALFHTQVYSDSPQRWFLHAPVFTRKEIGVKLSELIYGEIERIFYTQQGSLSQFEKLRAAGSIFQNIPELNDITFSTNNNTTLKFIDVFNLTEWQDFNGNSIVPGLSTMTYLSKSGEKVTVEVPSSNYKNLLEVIIEQVLLDNKNNFINYLAEEGVYNMIPEVVKGDEDVTGKIKEAELHSFYYNTYYNNIISQNVFGGDPANYKVNKGSLKTDIDIVKRTKQEISPNILKVFKRPNFSVIILEDILLKTPLFKDKGGKDIKANTTDAGAYHTLARRREIMEADPNWDLIKNDVAPIFDRIQNGTYTQEDLQTLDLQPLKPFVYTQIIQNIDTKKPDGTPGTAAIRVPIQLKDSEHVLLPTEAFLVEGQERYVRPTSLADIANGKYIRPDLAKLLYLMETQGVDLAVFESGSKAEIFNKISIDDVVEKNGIITINRKNSEGVISEDNFIDSTITLNNSDWGIQQEVPRKDMEAKVGQGSQEHKIMSANVDPNWSFKYDGIVYKGQEGANELLQSIQERNAEANLKKALKKITDKDGNVNIDKVLDILKEGIIEKNSNLESLEGLVRQADGKTLIPVELLGKKGQQVLNSILKKVSTFKVKGAALVNKPGFGYMGNRNNPNTFSDDLQLITEKAEDGSVIIKHWEAVVPVYDPIIYDYIDINGNLLLDENNNPLIPEKLLQAFFYRIPTEDKYSMFPIRIKRFSMPSQGGGIILPREATETAGLDFDVDKLYGYYYNFKVKTTPAELDSFKKYVLQDTNDRDLKSKYIDAIYGGYIEDIEMLQEKGLSEDDIPFIKKYSVSLRRYEKQYKIDNPTASFNKSVDIYESSLNTAEGTQNLKLDTYFSLTGTKAYGRDALKPGNKDRLTKLRNEVLANSTSPNYSYADPVHVTNNATKNIVGKRLIGIFANANSFYNLIQGVTKINLKGKLTFTVGSTIYNFTSLADVNPQISKNIAELLFASTEDVKDPVLEPLNINEITSSLLVTMLSLTADNGDKIIKFEDAIAVLSDPSIVEAVKKVQKDGGRLKDVYKGKYERLVNISDAYNNIISASKIDQELGPDFYTIQSKLASIDSIIEASTGRFYPLLTEDVIKILPTSSLNSDIKQLNVYRKALEKELAMFSSVYSFLQPTVDAILQSLGKISKNKKLRPSDMQKYSYMVYDAAIQGYLNSKGKLQDLKENFPKKLASYTFPEGSGILQQAFEIKNNVAKMRWVNISASDILTQYQNAFTDLFTSDPKFASDLATYAFLIGTNFSMDSIVKIVPNVYYNTTEGQVIRDIINGNQLSNALLNLSDPFTSVLFNNFTPILNELKDFTFKDGVYTSNTPMEDEYVYIREKTGNVLLSQTEEGDYYPVHRQEKGALPNYIINTVVEINKTGDSAEDIIDNIPDTMDDSEPDINNNNITEC